VHPPLCGQTRATLSRPHEAPISVERSLPLLPRQPLVLLHSRRHEGDAGSKAAPQQAEGGAWERVKSREASRLARGGEVRFWEHTRGRNLLARGTSTSERSGSVLV